VLGGAILSGNRVDGERQMGRGLGLEREGRRVTSKP